MGVATISCFGKPISKLLLALLTIRFFARCNTMSPAGFWRSYDSKHIVSKTSDQGPWGGHLSIYWQNKKQKYPENAILTFAAKNGWHLVTQQNISAGMMRHWIANNEPVFPLGSAGLDTTGFNSGKQFPLKIKNGCVLYKFDSGWTMVNHDQDRIAYGYVLVSQDKTQMAVYHLWGE